MTSWDKLLRSLGFTESETKLYLVSLAAGPATVQELAKKASISRVTAYAAVDALMKNGLMSTLQQGKKRLFSAESPDRLISFIHSRVQHMQSTLKEVETSVEELRLLQRGEKPIVKLFTGKEGIKALQNDLLEMAPDAIDELGNFDELVRVYPTAEHRTFFSKLDQMKPKRRLIFYTKEQQPSGEYIRSNFPDEHIAVIRGPESNKLFADIMVYGNHVSLATLRGELISVLIESSDLADAMRLLFDHAWKDTKDQQIC